MTEAISQYNKGKKVDISDYQLTPKAVQKIGVDFTDCHAGNLMHLARVYIQQVIAHHLRFGIYTDYFDGTTFNAKIFLEISIKREYHNYHKKEEKSNGSNN